jgi:two-component system, OmpR family, sensor kinase
VKPKPRIRRLLTAWYAVSVLVLLLFTVLAMRGIARQALAHQQQQALERSLGLVRSFFRAELVEYGRVDATIAHLAGELVFAGMGIDFLRPDSSAFASARKPRNAPVPRPPVRTYLVPLERDLAPGWLLRVTLSASEVVEARERIDKATLVALLLSVALAALVGWLVTGRALQPVAVMAEAVERIDASKPSERLPIANPHDELGRLGRRFNALLERLELAMVQQRRFLADAAHELRTPLARMLGETETRLSAPPSVEDRRSVERIHDDVLRASDLVNELMQLARADAGSTDAVLVPGYLDDVVSDSAMAFEAEARRRGITLAMPELEEAPADLDPRLITRLVGVLLHNALQYSPEGGRVEVHVTRDGENAMLRIADAGIGIPPDERTRVFERFYRGTPARQRAPEGSGLGLAIARWIAEQHRATIVVADSALGGVEFRVLFPPPALSRRDAGAARPAARIS